MEQIIFLLVVGLRFIVPLFIPRFPVPAILLSLLIDAVDQTVFAAFDVEPENYQSYDKALDIYYLSIAYISTVRNWLNTTAFISSQALWYFRLVGVLLFELTGFRTILFLFPNVFEYFFIYYESLRTRWKTSRITKKHLLVAIAFIWIVIKLPQEYWIHVAQLDFTDTMAAYPALWFVLGILLCIAIIIMRRYAHLLPVRDWYTSFDVDHLKDKPTDIRLSALTKYPLLEKTILVGLITTIFLRLLPSTQASLFDVIISAGLLIFIGSFVSTWLSSNGRTWARSGVSFIGTAAITVGVIAGLQFFSIDILANASIGLSLFLLMLFTLIVTLYDRFRNIRLEHIKI